MTKYTTEITERNGKFIVKVYRGKFFMYEIECTTKSEAEQYATDINA